MTADIFILNQQVNIGPLVRLGLEMSAVSARMDLSNIEKSGLIKFFEMAYEQSWKILKRVLLVHQGVEVTNGPREVFRKAAQYAYIEDPQRWFDFIEVRNETVHSYDEDTANHVISKLPDFEKELNVLITKLKSLS